MGCEQTLKIGIVAGEPSGDALAAGLMIALKQHYRKVTFSGVGGPKMRAAGCNTLYPMERIEVMGVDGLFGKLVDILKIRATLYRHFRAQPVDLFIGVDVPDFNLTLAQKLRSKGIKTVHYVSPTVWAWRGYRLAKIRRAVDHILALFPFEQAYYQQRQMRVTCVGHPIADEIIDSDQSRARAMLGIKVPPSQSLIALLPGSRVTEVERLGPALMEVVEKLSTPDSSFRFVLPLANERVAQALARLAGPLEKLPIMVLYGKARLAIEAADYAVLASGTAALEATLLARPHVVIYRLSPLTWWLFKKLKHVDYYSMSNHLLPTPDIPELIQQQVNADNIIAALRWFIDKPQRVRRFEQQCVEIRRQLKLSANVQAAAAIMKLLET